MIQKTWGWRIKRLGLTQGEVCNQIGIVACSLSNWINGNVQPQERSIVKMETYLRKLEKIAGIE